MFFSLHSFDKLNRVIRVTANGVCYFDEVKSFNSKAPSAARNFSSPGKFTDFLLLLRSAGGLFLRKNPPNGLSQ